MWDHQKIFRVTAQISAEGIFSILDRNLQPEVFLIGILPEENNKVQNVFIEPEATGFSPALFEAVMELAESLEITIDETPLYYAHPMERNRHERMLHEKALKRTVELIITHENKVQGDTQIAFCSWPAQVNEYTVFVVLQFEKAAYREHYALSVNSFYKGHPVSVSLLDATVYEFLQDCTKALRESEPSAGSAILDRDYHELIRAAGKRFMYTPAEGNHGLFDACNAISALKYEGDEGVGCMLLAKRNHPNIQEILTLEAPVSLRDYRSIRKLLELTQHEIRLITDAAFVYGLGKLVNTYNYQNEDLFIINFTKHYTWELMHAGEVMMRVTYGMPSLARSQLDKTKFWEKIENTFPDLLEEGVERLWSLTLEVINQRKGTLLVISAGADKEADRLSNQCFKVAPKEVNSYMIGLLTKIDGAVLIDPHGTCFAVGVILDGLSSERGDSSRGARYNSAIRYVETSVHACIAIVVSEDGMVNLIQAENV